MILVNGVKMKKKISYNLVNNKDCELIYKWIIKTRVRLFLSSIFRLKKINLTLLKVITKKNNSRWYLINYNQKNIGCIVFDDIDFEDKISNIWYFIGEDKFLNQNLCYTAIKNLLFENPIKLNAVTAWVSSNNLPSNKLLNKLKFKKIGKIPNTFKISKKIYDRILYYKILDK